jgi:hypothetical protein
MRLVGIKDSDLVAADCGNGTARGEHIASAAPQ